MAQGGVAVFHDITAEAVVGWTESFRRWPDLFRAFRLCARRLEEERPRALVLVDFPEFNIRLARVAHRLGIPAVYFVPPQVWAWRRWRVRVIRRFFREVLACFPFETDFYARAGVPVEFIGHPLLDQLPSLTREEGRQFFKIGADELLVGLLPGSRKAEVGRLLPIMLDAAAEVVRRTSMSRVLIGLAPTVTPEEVRPLVDRHPSAASLIEGETYRLMAAADCLLVASGTATLEAACFGTPMVVCYKTSLASYWLARALVRIPWISLANIVAGRPVVPELIQDNLTPDRLSALALSILKEPAVAQAQRKGLAEVRERLGAPGASRRAARRILEIAGHPEFCRTGGGA